MDDKITEQRSRGSDRVFAEDTMNGGLLSQSAKHMPDEALLDLHRLPNHAAAEWLESQVRFLAGQVILLALLTIVLCFKNDVDAPSDRLLMAAIVTTFWVAFGCYWFMFLANWRVSKSVPDRLWTAWLRLIFVVTVTLPAVNRLFNDYLSGLTR